MCFLGSSMPLLYVSVCSFTLPPEGLGLASALPGLFLLAPATHEGLELSRWEVVDILGAVPRTW